MKQKYTYKSTPIKIKKQVVFALMLFLAFASQLRAACPPGNVSLASQAQVNAFATNYPNCTEISGYLQISGNDITDLSPLSNLTSVGSCFIYGNPNLTNLHGLSNLTSVGGYLNIYNNATLTNLDGLSALESVGGYLSIDYNSALTNLDGLSNLTQIGAYLTIQSNPQLTDISGLSNIDPTTIGGAYGLYIVNNTNLSTCNLDAFCTYLQGSGLRTIWGNAGDCVSEVAVATACTPACDVPTNLTATNITSVSAALGWISAGNNFDIEWGTQGFTQGSGTMVTDIATNSYNLTSLSSNTQYQFYVRQDCSATQSDWAGPFGFTTLSQCPPGDVALSYQADVDNFAINYPNCTEIQGYLNIYASNITNLDGLSALTSLGGYLNIFYNPGLTNLNGLSALTSVGGVIYIENNPSLTDISGLENITGFTDLYIIDNNALSVCNIASVCAFLQGSGYRYIVGNATGCESVDAVITACTPACDAPTNLTVTNTTSVSATLGWTSTGNNFDIEWGTAGFTQGTGTTQNGVSALNYQITGLSQSTSYEVYVRQNCTDNQSDWVKVTFSTIAQCPSGSITLRSQADVDNFGMNYPNCTVIQGNLIIEGVNSNSNTNITNLDGLSALTTVTGSVHITNSPELITLEPLSYLTTVGGNFQIYNCHALTNLNGLSALTSVGLNLHIDQNNALTNFNALSALTTVGGSFNIYNHSSLTTLDGLSNLTQITGNLDIKNNFSLATLDGISNLTTVGGALYIEGNFQLAVCNNAFVCNFSGTKYITNNASGCNSEAEVIAACFPCEIPSSITTSNITSNQATINWTNSGTFDLEWGTAGFTQGTGTTENGVSGLNYQITGLTESTSYEVYVRQNCTDNQSDWVKVTFSTIAQCPSGSITLRSQADVDNFGMNYPNCTVIQGNLIIEGVNSNSNTNITNLDGLSALTTVTGSVHITNSPELITLEPLSYLTTVGGNFQIYNCHALTNLNGLSALTSVGLNLHIDQNNALTNFNALSALTTVGGSFNIYNHSSLTTLDGLSNLTQITGNLDIKNNFSLATLDGLSTLTSIGGMLSIDSNPLSNLNGLNSLESIGEDIAIYFTELTNLDGLSNLNLLGADISIGYNNLLTDISGLSGITTINPVYGYGLQIFNNPLLSTCNLTIFCDYLSNDESTHPRSITGNAPGCESDGDILTNCATPACPETIWNGTAWSNGEPDANKKAIINGNLVLSNNLSACELEINETGSLTVSSGKSFTVIGKITNNATSANFVVQNEAAILQVDNVQNEGSIKVNVTSYPLYRQDYTLWSSPVSSQNLRSFSPLTLYNRFSSYDTSIGTAGDYVQEIFTTQDALTKTFTTGKGYLIRTPNNWPEYVNNATPGTSYEGQFTGTPQNGNITIPLSTANTGFNLVGNPYPSAITIQKLYDANPAIEQTIYFWRKRNGASGSGYATLNSMGFVSVHPELTSIGSQIYASGSINTGQGFFVKSTGATQLVFNNDMRTTASQGTFLRNASEEKHRIWLNLSNATGIVGQTLIGYTAAATSGVDQGFDGAYFNDSSTALTSLINGNEYSIQGLGLPFDASSTVPLGFKTDVAGMYTLSLHQYDGLFEEDQNIYIKDNLTGWVHNVKESPYNFTASEGIANARFEVLYQTTLGTDLPVDVANKVMVYKQEKDIHINAMNVIIQKVALYDTSGRLITEVADVNQSTAILNNLSIANQVVLVKITSIDNKIVTKKIVY